MPAADLGREVVQAIRALRRTPSLVAIIVVCLGIGIGANSTVFSWMEEMVLRPIPAIRDPGQLVLVGTLAGKEQQSVSYPTYRDVRDGTRTLSGVAGFTMTRFGLQDPAHAASIAEPVWGTYASGNYFQVLGARPLLGRTLLPADESTGAAPVAVLGYGLWERRFAGDPAIVGKHIRLNGRDVTVVGVVPPSFTGTFAGLSFDVWVPITTMPVLGDDPGVLEQRGSRFFQLFGRRRPGVSLAQTRAEMAALGQHIASREPPGNQFGLDVVAWNAGPGERFMRPLLVVLLGVTGLVLLVVCSNVASLLLARGAARQRELGVRVALGASRGRLVRQLVIEGALLAAGGAVAAVAVAAWGRSILGAVMPGTTLPIVIDPHLDWRVLAFTVAISLGGCILFALLPALRTSRIDVVTALRTGASSVGGNSRLRMALVGAQAAFALTAIVCAGLFLRSLSAQRRVDPGFRDADHVLLFPIDLSLAGIPARVAQQRLTMQLLDRVRALPGVRSAAMAGQVPLGFEGWGTFQVRVPGYAARSDESMAILAARVTSGYFQTMGIAITDGRPLDDTDREGGATAVVVNEEFARRYFGGRPAVGERIDIGREATIVGVAHNGKYVFDRLDAPSPPVLYLAEPQFPTAQLVLHVHIARDATAIGAAVRRELVAAAPTLPIVSPLTLREYTAAALLPDRLGALMLSGLGAIALLLSAIGLYGRLAYAVAQRTREIGVRLAIGATPRQVTSVVLRDGLRLAGVGAGCGLLLAVAAGRALGAAIPRLAAIDLPILAGATAVLLLVALTASWLPARRASRTDLLTALRAE